MTESDYLQQLQALLPQGSAWSRESNANLTQLLSALAAEFLRLDNRGGDLVQDAVPTHTQELLSDWERVAGIVVYAGVTLEQRQAALVEKLNYCGGQSAEFFIAYAASLGIAITIREYRPFRVGIKRMGEPLTNGGWTFVWQVTIHQLSDENTERLCRWMDQCKPAHTLIEFV